MTLAKIKERTEKLMPNGVPRWIRCYDNGGVDAETFCTKCYRFMAITPSDMLCPYEECQHKLIEAPSGSVDCYTVIFSGRYPGRRRGLCQYVAMDGHPFHPLGFGQHGEADIIIDAPRGFTPQLGRLSPFGARRIPFDLLPDDCKKLVIGDYKGFWGLSELISSEIPEDVLARRWRGVQKQ